MSNLPNAHSREEILLKAIAESQAIDSPEPKSRVEIYLKQIMENGSISPEEIQAAVDAYLAEHPLEMDASLVDPLKAAPAGVVGERLSELKSDLVYFSESIKGIESKQIKRSILNIKKNFYPYEYPSAFLGTYRPIDVFTDGTSYFAEFNESDFKHSGGTTYYTGKNGIWSNDGLTPDKPTSLRNAIVNLAQSGDTVFVSEGVYGTEFLMNIPYIISKGINIIGENDSVIFVYGNKGTFSFDETNQCYKAQASYVGRVIDFSKEHEIEYKKLTSVSDVQNNKYSFYTDNSYVWVNSPNLSDLMLVKASETFRVANTENARLYVRGISFVGGSDAILVSKNKDYSLECIFYKCKFNYATNGCGINAKGGNYLFVDCEANGNKADGFCYSGYNNNSEAVDINFFEVNCIGANNGLGDTSYTHNGSTCHNGAKGIRVNGNYYNNNGGNVVDVHSNTQTINIGCMAFDSACPRSQSYCQGFGLQQESAEMWLENCIAFGNLYDYFTVPNTTIHSNKCARESGNDITSYHGTLDETNRREMYYFANILN